MTPLLSVGIAIVAIVCLGFLFVVYKLTAQNSKYKKEMAGRKVAQAARVREQINAALGNEGAEAKPAAVATTKSKPAPTAAAPQPQSIKPKPAEPAEPAANTPPPLNQPAKEMAPPIDIPAQLVGFKPVLEEDMSEQDLMRITDMTDKILRPKSIFSALVIGQLGPKELAEVVASDPEIAAKMLRIVNSAAYGLTKKITSVQRAAIFLGTFLVRDISMRLCMQSSFKQGDAILESAYQLYWQSSTLASTICQRLANTYGLPDASSLATRSLLSFIGNLVILSNLPEISEKYSSLSSLYHRTHFEENLLHTNAAVLGSILARKWRLPDEIEEGIKRSLFPMFLSPDKYPFDDIRETTISYLSCRIGEQIIFDKIEDLADIKIDKEKAIEYCYLPSYLYFSNMEDIHEQLQNPKLRQDVNHIISQLKSHSRSEAEDAKQNKS